MNWTVDWLPDCEQELAAIWINSRERDAVTRASHRIDKLLRSDPENAGESRPSNRRILFEPPLGVIYRALSDQWLVQVLHIWEF